VFFFGWKGGKTDPSPRAAPRVALDENQLRGGARSPDAVYRRLVEPEHERVVHVVVLVIGVKDDLAVAGKELGRGRPPGLETINVGDDLFVVPA
jgi:hypothetical protein